VEASFSWVQRAAQILENASQASYAQVRRAYRELLLAMAPLREQEDPLLSRAATHFLKVTKSHWRGLFACYAHPDLPRTNNGLEQYFGSWRYHERRITGRKVNSPSTVIRGGVRLMSAVLTRLKPPRGADLRPARLQDWYTLRAELEKRHELRRQQRRFRRDPQAYLRAIEEKLLKSTLPT
jgi:hypothetical protein